MVYCIPKYHVDLEKDKELSMNYVISGYQYTIQSPFSRLAHEFVHIYNIIYPSELVNLRVFFSRFPSPRLIRKLIRDPVPEFPVETMDLQQLGAQTSRVEPLVVKEPVLEVCDLDFPEKSEDVEFPKCRLGVLFLFQVVYRHYPTFINCLGTVSVVFSIRPRALFLQVGGR
jgi:hypothetical protein